MDQYHPAYHADRYPELDRRISSREYQSVVDAAISAGMTNLDQRSPKFFAFI